MPQSIPESEDLGDLLFNFSWDTHLVKVENHSGKLSDEEAIRQLKNQLKNDE